MKRGTHFRSSPRPQLSRPVTIRVPGRIITATTRDVSTGGLFIFTDEPFELGDIIDVDLSTPSTWEPLTLRAKVCRISEESAQLGVGLQFLEVTDTELVALIRLIAALDFES